MPDPQYGEIQLSPAADVPTPPNTKNYGGDPWLGVGRVQSSASYRFAMGFDLPAQVKGKKIVEAKLYLYSRYVSSVRDFETSVELRDILASWDESQVVYDTFPAYNAQPALIWQVPAP